ncbi:YbjN domain-containing protein [Amaricoccus solimangrovi]|uniref:Diacylglyceryl transferase n=1 Tax=Amaricoccus solimangrovi TaxID=2589815 RepID=A0A501WSK5_9RHOB|nr:YbjN domain-containing protein [Amaricoccus solimangrovi]TPE51340.1 diacylglyceryl transferase [Amaricoccus solimangrovi]
MGIVERDFDCEEIHPIDIVETLAEERSWDFDRVADDQIAMAIEGSWRTYSVTLAWSAQDESLRLICAFEMAPPARKLNALNRAIMLANDKCWLGAFVLWPEQKMMAFRYALNLTGGAMASSAQINDMVRAAVMSCERFYPAFQLVAWGNESPETALGIAMTEAYGRA